MNELAINFQFKARYYKLGEINAHTKQVWFALHGYGQLAQYFAKKFNMLVKQNVCVIVPEGLSRFYLEQLDQGGRKNNRVGATWMTRENRDMDIENYLTYLDSIYANEIGARKIAVTVLGFSQGSATATRWVLHNKINFERLILWSGIFPPDMNFERGNKILKQKETLLVYGTQDPFLNDSRFAEMKMLTEKLNVEVKQMTFDGGHDIDEATLANLIG
jgi:predicted esterase